MILFFFCGVSAAAAVTEGIAGQAVRVRRSGPSTEHNGGVADSSASSP